MAIYALGERVPMIAESAYVHPDAVIIGDVTIGSKSSIWPGAILRGDRGRIVIGDSTSIQDGTVVHCNARADTLIGSRCVVGHVAHLEGCTIEDDCLVGAGSVILSGAIVGPNALVGASALIPPGMVVPQFARALGVPAVLQQDSVKPDAFASSVKTYEDNASWYANELRQLS
jgi:carbonic anhydrase/acetyltransferase-like protein (isoleucine patch superfamily)